MHLSQLKQSNYLKKDDCGNGILVTIKSVFEENIAKEGAPPEIKWAMSFNELEKPMILNTTNGAIIAAITGSENSDDWIGHQVVLYNEPSVSYQGKVTGGIRVRAPRGKAAQKPKPQPKPAPQPEPTDEDVPF